MSDVNFILTYREEIANLRENLKTNDRAIQIVAKDHGYLSAEDYRAVMIQMLDEYVSTTVELRDLEARS